MDKILYGAAYYDEYMPYERLDKDIKMMKKAGINVIRIAESTWSTEEREEGVFDFSHVIKVLNKCEEEGMHVIIGTPTYAIPAWMVKMHPEIMVMNRGNRLPYGARQIMDITHPGYRFYAERIIRKLLLITSEYKCVIGYQLDNETKHFFTSSQNVQFSFVRYMRNKYNNDLEKLNFDYGLNYWSNRINSWEEFPDMTGTINGSLGCEFEKFQRSLVTEFLKWQSEIVKEYIKEDQFITHNFDFGWRGHSFGIQPDVDHFKAAEALSIAGCDIYHPSQKHLTGREIAFCGDVTRSLKNDNYLVIETEAQGFPEWTPYKGQLRLQAFSHFASGADSVMYWHWHSLHNACETYWKGILSHDLAENEIYREVSIVGNEIKELNGDIIHLKKKNKIAIMVSNEAYTAIKWFPFPRAEGEDYNTVLRWVYDALYDLNYECDIITPDTENLGKYSMIFTPALYSISEENIKKLIKFGEEGGILISTFKTAFTNEFVKVWPDTQPYLLNRAFGIKYDQFTKPEDTMLSGEGGEAKVFMELINEEGATAISKYDHYAWKDYAAITKNKYKDGYFYYFGTKIDDIYFKKNLINIMSEHGFTDWKQEYSFPLIIKEGLNEKKEKIIYVFNYSEKEKTIKIPFDGIELTSKKEYKALDEAKIYAWNFIILKV